MCTLESKKKTWGKLNSALLSNSMSLQFLSDDFSFSLVKLSKRWKIVRPTRYEKEVVEAMTG